MTICPSCGFKFFGDMRRGCKMCGARSVGEPLPRVGPELPAYGRSMVLVIAGSLMAMWFLTQIIIVMVESGLSLSLWSWIDAAEAAAWRVKSAIPITIIVLWGGIKIYRSMLKTPSRFVGMKEARLALIISALIILMIATLIGITVPARLRRQQITIKSTELAKYTPTRAAVTQLSS